MMHGEPKVDFLQVLHDAIKKWTNEIKTKHATMPESEHHDEANRLKQTIQDSDHANPPESYSTRTP